MRPSRVTVKILLLLALFLTCLSPSAFAGTDIHYTPTQVYFADNGDLIVKGFWSNSGAAMRHVKSALVEVSLIENTGKEDPLTKCNFPQMNLAVAAGDITKCSFTIKGVKRTPIGRWHTLIHYKDTP